ncbi:hypothetical protein HanIR_Chr01g0031691 [Helianthus annuus]|nr:hypothetical protein HanIR_Chr01g0031691 [Helianthus annuus]
MLWTRFQLKIHFGSRLSRCRIKSRFGSRSELGSVRLVVIWVMFSFGSDLVNSSGSMVKVSRLGSGVKRFRLTRVNSVRLGQTESTQLTRSNRVNSVDSVNSVKRIDTRRLEYCRMHASKSILGNDITKS